MVKPPVVLLVWNKDFVPSTTEMLGLLWLVCTFSQGKKWHPGKFEMLKCLSMSYFCQDEEKNEKEYNRTQFSQFSSHLANFPFFLFTFLFVAALYLSPNPLCLKRLEVLFCCCVVLFCLFSVGNFLSVRHTKEREPGNVCRRTEILIFLRRVRDATPALFLKNTNVIRDARDLKVPPFLMITFNMHRKSFFTDSGRLSTEWRSN